MRKTVQISSELKKEFSKIQFSSETIDGFGSYFEILSQWNKKINLTAVRDPDEMIVKHLLDSLVVYNTSTGANLASPATATVMDIGSGAGIPGILLQIANPSLTVYSIDKLKKKIGFQEFVKAKLGLKNLVPISERIESLIASRKYEKSLDFIVSRAFDQIKDLFEYSSFFLAEKGSLILWKGKEWQRELSEVPAILMDRFRLIESHDYQLDHSKYGGTILVFRSVSQAG